jgi:hypothetical protein
MVYIRSKKVDGRIYYYIVEGKINKKDKVQQKVLLYLGTAEKVYKKLKPKK